MPFDNPDDKPRRYFKHLADDDYKSKRMLKVTFGSHTHVYRAGLLKKFYEVEAECGTEEAVMQVWRAGKRSGHVARQREKHNGKHTGS